MYDCYATYLIIKEQSVRVETRGQEKRGQGKRGQEKLQLQVPLHRYLITSLNLLAEVLAEVVIEIKHAEVLLEVVAEVAAEVVAEVQNTMVDN